MRHLALLALLGPSASQPQPPALNFTRHVKAVLPWLTPITMLPCSLSAPCDIAALSAACSAFGRNGSQPPTAPCQWGPETASTYISGCAQPPPRAGTAAAAVNCINFPSLAQAQAACEQDPYCSGVTSQGGGAPPWEMRAGHALLPNGGSDNSSSLLLLNPQACHPGAAPAACNAFDTHGRLFACPQGSCDCHGSSQACMRGRDIYTADPRLSLGENDTDVYTAVGPQAPLAAWQAGIAMGSILFGSPEGPACYLPEIGNGYLATVPSWGSLHLAGLYNGRCGDTTKARLPSPVALSLGNSSVTAGALDMAQGVYSRLWAVGGAGGGGLVEFRVWAHRTRKHVLVAELLLVQGSSSSSSSSLTLNITTLWDPATQSTGVTGNGCAGGFSRDLAWALPPTLTPLGASLYSAHTTTPSDAGLLFNVSVAMDEAPATLTLTPDQPSFRMLVAIASSLDFEGDAGSAAQVSALAAAEYASAAAVAPPALFAEHCAGWAALQGSGIEVAPDAGGGEGAAAQALDVAQHVNSSYYFLLSSLREDVHRGISPGGLSTENYQGAVFMDQDFWMEPPLYYLAPQLAAAILRSRLDSLPTMRINARLFGYEGAMAAWTAAYAGNPFGCCSGKGGYEDCLEQHVTGDVAVSVWQYFLATGNVTWLGGFFPLLAGIADFHLSRVTPTPALNATAAAYHIEGVLPIDEWCVGSGCGCESPGVTDDAQMNAVSKLSLLLAARAAGILGNGDSRAALWQHTGENLVLLFNSSGGGHHDQFTSPTCPSGWGGSHYSTSHTVCPEDVLLLSYPLGDLLNTSHAVTAADAALFIPITCLENAGMTTPIHTIVWLQLGQVDKAQAEFNRTMHAACYGSFMVRNEVDKHEDMPGAHYDNTHFLTGDGGMLQAMLAGWGGLRLQDGGLGLLAPTLPEGVGALTLRRISFRGLVLTVVVTATQQTVQAVAGAPGISGATITDAQGAAQRVAVGGPAVVLPRATFVYPGQVALL